MIDRDQVLKGIKSLDRPTSFRTLMEHMGLPKRASREFKRVLKQLVSSGEVVRTKRGLYGPPEEMSLVTGYYEAHRDGFGFLILEKPGQRDLFIPARASMGAMDNDIVMARVENGRRREGRVVRILRRAFHRVSGRVEAEGRSLFLRPRHVKMPFDIIIPPKDRGEARDGDSAIVEITVYPTDSRPPEGRVVKVLSEPDSPKAEIESVIDEFNIPRRFPSEVLHAAAAIHGEAASKFPVERGRRDLSSLKTITIDGERARDFDDAVSIELTAEGFRLYVHIADVSHFVKWDDRIDLEARERGTSVYLPDRVAPMLPPVLSEEICSLKPGVKRMTFTVEMLYDRRGNRVSERFYPSFIVSNERMTYTSVSRIIVDSVPAERQRYEDLLGEFDLMAELCGLLRAKRMERGSLDFDLPEPDVILDLEGRPERIINAERNFAHIIIEEFMIAANEAVAQFVEARGVPCIFRVHEEPDKAKLAEIQAVAVGVAKIRKKDLGARDIPSLLRKIKGNPAEEVVNYLILRSLKQARYSVTNVGHFGLASQSYTHFTSPIRRYPDLIVHRILKDVLGSGKGIPEKRVRTYEAILPDIAMRSSRAERMADTAEREVVNAM
ncbi:MAG: ribonuclease R, partial [Thermodesulfovibrionales bacterium]